MPKLSCSTGLPSKLSDRAPTLERLSLSGLALFPPPALGRVLSGGLALFPGTRLGLDTNPAIKTTRTLVHTTNWALLISPQPISQQAGMPVGTYITRTSTNLRTYSVTGESAYRNSVIGFTSASVFWTGSRAGYAGAGPYAFGASTSVNSASRYAPAPFMALMLLAPLLVLHCELLLGLTS